MNYITGTNLIIIAILFIIGCLIASFLLVNFVKIIFAYITNNIHQNYIKNSHLKSKYTIKGSFLRMLIVSVAGILFTWLHYRYRFLSIEPKFYRYGDEVISLPFFILLLWFWDYKLRNTLINIKAFIILTLLEVILTVLNLIFMIGTAVFPMFLVISLLPFVMYYGIKKLSLSLYNEYPTDKINEFVTNKIKTFIRFVIPIILLIFISIFISIDIIYEKRNYDSSFAITCFVTTLANIVIVWYFDSRMRILVYLQKNLFLFVLLNLLIFVLMSAFAILYILF